MIILSLWLSSQFSDNSSSNLVKIEAVEDILLNLQLLAKTQNTEYSLYFHGFIKVRG